MEGERPEEDEPSQKPMPATNFTCSPFLYIQGDVASSVMQGTWPCDGTFSRALGWLAAPNLLGLGIRHCYEIHRLVVLAIAPEPIPRCRSKVRYADRIAQKQRVQFMNRQAGRQSQQQTELMRVIVEFTIPIWESIAEVQT